MEFLTERDALGSTAFQTDGVIQRAIQCIKVQAPQLLLIADVCFCEYTNHGHCNVVYQNSRGHYDVNNDQTNELLIKQATSLV